MQDSLSIYLLTYLLSYLAMGGKQRKPFKPHFWCSRSANQPLLTQRAIFPRLQAILIPDNDFENFENMFHCIYQPLTHSVADMMQLVTFVTWASGHHWWLTRSLVAWPDDLRRGFSFQLLERWRMVRSYLDVPHKRGRGRTQRRSVVTNLRPRSFPGYSMQLPPPPWRSWR